MEEQLKEANRQVLKGQELPGQEDMKTTAVALAIEGNTAYWAHVGIRGFIIFPAENWPALPATTPSHI